MKNIFHQTTGGGFLGKRHQIIQIKCGELTEFEIIIFEEDKVYKKQEGRIKDFPSYFDRIFLFNFSVQPSN